MGNVFRQLMAALASKNMEIVIIGLENSGKTTLLNLLSGGINHSETTPTIGLNVKEVKNGGVSMKCWDLGGQAQYRVDWGRYTRGCDAILFVVDASNFSTLSEARGELHRLLEQKDLQTTPILVLGNKIDLSPHMTEGEIIKGLNLDYIVDNPWAVIPCSALRNLNIPEIVKWLSTQVK